MEQKSNDATPLRPQGDRTINANFVEMDLNQFIQQIKDEPTWKDSDHNAITLFKSDDLRIVLMGMHAQSTLKTHTANATISVQVLEGNIHFTAENETKNLHKGQMIALHPKLPHSVFAVTESFFLLTMSTFRG